MSLWMSWSINHLACLELSDGQVRRTHRNLAAIARPASQQVAAGKSTANPKTPYDAMKLEDMEQLGAIKL